MIETRRVVLEPLLPAESATCTHCLGRLESFLQGLPGIDAAHLDARRESAIVHFDPAAITPDGITDALRHEGTRLGETYAHLTTPVEGMDCTDCALTLERGVARLSGVEWVSVSFTGARMALEYRPETTTLGAISKRVTDLGYRLGGLESGRTSGAAGTLGRLFADRANQAALGGAALTGLAVGAGLRGAPHPVEVALYGGAIVLAGLPIARKAVRGLLATRRLDINVLMTVAVIGAAALGQWLEAATVVVLFSLGEALEGYTADRARESVRELLRLAPAEATVRSGGLEQRVAASAVVPGDVVVVRPGERLPVDGVVIAGTSTVDQAPVTGESVPVEKVPGAKIFSGTINGSGVLDVRATRAASDSTIARIIRMVEAAQERRAPTQRFVDRFAAIYTPVVVAGAAAVAVVPPLVGGGAWSSWIYRALVLLVISCPCALVISTPVAIVSALSAAARNGVLIKGGLALESLAGVRAVALDKTGTLTAGRPEVSAVVALDGVPRDDVLRMAAAVERYSEHPLGRAIVRAADQAGIPYARERVSDVRASAGHGISARLEGTLVAVGNQRFFAGVPIPSAVSAEAEAIERAGQTVALVALDGRLVGVLGVTDPVRRGATDALRALMVAGIRETVMLTGDRPEVARAVGDAAGVGTVVAELLPADKVRAVEDLLQRHGSVAMVGDGVNDAPALARSTVGIAMGAAGTDAALETADVALMGDDLGKVAFAVRLARRARATVAQNVAFALAIKLAVLVLALLGMATLWEAVFADVGAALIVILNGMRLLRYRAN